MRQEFIHEKYPRYFLDKLYLNLFIPNNNDNNIDFNNYLVVHNF